MLERGLRRNDLDLARDWAERIVSTVGPVASLEAAGTARFAPRVLAGVAREDARRELGGYDDGLQATLASAEGGPAEADRQPAPAASSIEAAPAPTPEAGPDPRNWSMGRASFSGTLTREGGVP
ncbi:MAG: hypothetical protein AVDCRST_MAG08-3389 [uncultured Acetobacteraceae bacterium]|uniref:Uncharacterized protein n=1 Tax=uncultured Acetobacteraceae bacterium TaxID=169975 RepID=A0A6J4JAV7_9PROT|nr:MAG: hypothetical protein AVDCRST_MAG08-3389 [uncultured Acetobacteraceae bacterium]